MAVIRYKKDRAIRYKRGPSIRYIGSNSRDFFLKESLYKVHLSILKKLRYIGQKCVYLITAPFNELAGEKSALYNRFLDIHRPSAEHIPNVLKQLQDKIVQFLDSWPRDPMAKNYRMLAMTAAGMIKSPVM